MCIKPIDGNALTGQRCLVSGDENIPPFVFLLLIDDFDFLPVCTVAGIQRPVADRQLSPGQRLWLHS